MNLKLNTLKKTLILSGIYIIPIYKWTSRIILNIIFNKYIFFFKLNIDILLYFLKNIFKYLNIFFKKGNYLLLYLSDCAYMNNIYKCMFIYLYNKSSISFFYDIYLEGSISNYITMYLILIKELFNRFTFFLKSKNKINLLLRLLFITIHLKSDFIDIIKYKKHIRLYYWRIFLYYYYFKHLLCIPQSICILNSESLYLSTYTDFNSLNLPIIGNFAFKINNYITYPLFGNNSLLFMILINNFIKNIWLLNIIFL